MEDAELRSILFSIQGSIVSFQNDMSEVKRDISDMKSDIINVKSDIINMKSDIINMKVDIRELQEDVKNIELKLENDVGKKISVLFDAHTDELRYRKENKETREIVNGLVMRVDNLEKSVMTA